MEKLSSVILALATHPGRIKDRLKESMMHYVGFTAAPFSERVQDRYRDIHGRLTVVTNEKDGTLYASIDSMSEEEAQNLAVDLFSLYFDAGEEYQEER